MTTKRTKVTKAPAARLARKWFELECRRCGARFAEMKDLLFHRCAAVTARKEGDDETRKTNEGN